MTLRYLLDALLVMDQGSKQRAKDMPPILTILSFSFFFLILCLAWVHTPRYNFFLLQQRLGWRHWCKSYTRSRGAFKGKMQKTMDSWLDRRRAFGLGIGSLASFWWIMVRASTALIWTFVLLESRDKRSLTDKRKRWEFCFFSE